MKTIAIFTTKRLSPPEDGVADIICKVLDYLAHTGRYQIVLVSFCPQPNFRPDNVSVVYVKIRFRPFNLFFKFLLGYPLQVALYHHRQLRRQIERLVVSNQIDLIITDMLRTSYLALNLGTKTIMGLGDMLSIRYNRALTVNQKQPSFGKLPFHIPGTIQSALQPFMNLILRIEAKRMAKHERLTPGYFDAVVLVSSDEAQLLSELTQQKNIHGIPNYIEFDASTRKVPSPAKSREELIFFGNLLTEHNIDAALYLAEVLYPKVRARRPSAKLTLLGRGIAPQIQALAGEVGIEIHADVDITEYVPQASVCVVPHRFGSGIKTKILESIYLGTPVVTTPIGAEGIPDADQCMTICNTDEEFVDSIIAVMDGEVDVKRMNKNGRNILKNHFSKVVVTKKWQAVIDAVMEGR